MREMMEMIEMRGRRGARVAATGYCGVCGFIVRGVKRGGWMLEVGCWRLEVEGIVQTCTTFWPRAASQSPSRTMSLT